MNKSLTWKNNDVFASVRALEVPCSKYVVHSCLETLPQLTVVGVGSCLCHFKGYKLGGCEAPNEMLEITDLGKHQSGLSDVDESL